MKIELEVREIYGSPVIYPICDTAKNFAKLAKTKTLTLDSIKIIQDLGVEIRFVSCPTVYRHIPAQFEEVL